VLRTGVDPFGGVFNAGAASGVIDTDKVWWVQAEAIVGFARVFLESGRSEFLDAALGTWHFTRRYVSDREQGEWFWRVSWDGFPAREHEKVGPWKCPYHNARACLELVSRVGQSAPPAARIQ
jgi:cellobiose epimerase